MHPPLAFVAIIFFLMVSSFTLEVNARLDNERRGELTPLPVWNNAPPSPYTFRNKGDTGDADPRGSVRYNIGANGRIVRGVITKHREVPSDDIGTGLDQAREECCWQDAYY